MCKKLLFMNNSGTLQEAALLRAVVILREAVSSSSSSFFYKTNKCVMIIFHSLFIIMCAAMDAFVMLIYYYACYYRWLQPHGIYKYHKRYIYLKKHVRRSQSNNVQMFSSTTRIVPKASSATWEATWVSGKSKKRIDWPQFLLIYLTNHELLFRVFIFSKTRRVF